MDLKKQPVDELTYEEALAELERIVSVLEIEEQTLENAISLYERGQELTRHCAQLLEKAELRIRAIDDVENSSNA